jgi:hypothetical protein
VSLSFLGGWASADCAIAKTEAAEKKPRRIRCPLELVLNKGTSLGVGGVELGVAAGGCAIERHLRPCDRAERTPRGANGPRAREAGRRAAAIRESIVII